MKLLANSTAVIVIIATVVPKLAGICSRKHNLQSITQSKGQKISEFEAGKGSGANNFGFNFVGDETSHS